MRQVGRLISDCGGRDRLESLIFAIVLMLMNLTVILMIVMNLTMVLMIILTERDKKNRWKTLTLAPWQFT